MSWSWAEIAGGDEQRERFEALSLWLKEQGLTNSYSPLRCAPEDFTETLQEAKKHFDQIRVGPPFGVKLVQDFAYQSSQSQALGAADSLYFDGQNWWPRSATHLAWQAQLSLLRKAFDLSSSVMVVGNGAMARTSVVALIQLGFKDFKVTGRNLSHVAEMIQDLRRVHFGVRMEVLPPEKLVLLPGTSLILVNATPLSESNLLLPELHYLNFLRRDGWVFDLSLSRQDTDLVQEAQEIGVGVVTGYQLAALADMEWIYWCTGKKYVNHPDLRPVTKNVTPV